MKYWINSTLILGITICAHSALAAPKIVYKIAVVVENSVIMDSDIHPTYDHKLATSLL